MPKLHITNRTGKISQDYNESLRKIHVFKQVSNNKEYTIGYSTCFKIMAAYRKKQAYAEANRYSV